MSTPKATNVEIPFTRGLRQDVGLPFVPLGGLLQADNLEFDATGTLQRREGISALGTTAYTAGTYISPTRRFGLGPDGQPLLFTDNAAWQYLTDLDKIVPAAAGAPATLQATIRSFRTMAAHQNAGTTSGTGQAVVCGDCGRYGTLTLFAYFALDFAGLYGLYIDVVDDSGAHKLIAQNIGSFNLTDFGCAPKVIVLSTGIAFVFAPSTTNLMYSKIDLTASTLTVGSLTNLVTDLDNTGSASAFDVATTSDASNAQTRFVLGYGRNVAGTRNTVMVTYDSTPAVVNAAVVWTTSGGGAAMTSKSIGVTGATSTSTKIFAATCDTTSNTMQTWKSSYTLGSIAKASEAVADAVGKIQTVVGRMGNSDAAAICYGGPTSGAGTLAALGRMRLGVLDSTGAYAGGVGSFEFAGYGPASKFFVDTSGNLYIIGLFVDSAQVQRHYVLFWCGKNSSGSGLKMPLPLARIGNGLAQYQTISGVPSVPGTSAGQWVFATPMNIGASSLQGQCIGVWQIQTRGPDRYLNFVAHGATHVAGAAPLTYDSQRLVETGFFHYPDVLSTSYTRAAVGGSMAQGIYEYRFAWEWIDASGNRHQSPASPTITVDMSAGAYVAGTNKVTWSIAPLHCTRKAYQAYVDNGTAPTADGGALPRLVMYRSVVGGARHYRHPVGADTTQISPIVMLAVVDTLADTSINTNPLLFADAGILAMDAGPASLHMTAHGLRVWGTDAENGERAWASKLLEDGEAMSPSLALEVRIPGCGRISALAGQDEKLYALCENGIWIASYGDGPNNIGQGAFPDPIFITATATCDDPRGVIAATDGIYFSGPGRWGTTIYLIKRGDGNPIDIGKRVRTELTTYPVVRSVTERIDKGRIEFLVVNNDSSATTAKILYYHYDLLDEEGIGQWTASLPYSGTDAGIAILASGNRTYVATNTHVGYQSSSGGSSDAGDGAYYTLQTGDVRPFGLLGNGEVHSMNLLATSLAGGAIMMSASYDQGNTFPESTENTATDTTGYPELRRWEPPTKKLASACVRYKLTDYGTEAGLSSVKLHALVLEAWPLGSTVRLRQGAMT